MCFLFLFLFFLIRFLLLLLQRGKFYAQMTNLVKINTPKAVATETRKALRKLPNLESALNNLSSLKGVGTTMATGKSLIRIIINYAITCTFQYESGGQSATCLFVSYLTRSGSRLTNGRRSSLRSSILIQRPGTRVWRRRRRRLRSID